MKQIMILLVGLFLSTTNTAVGQDLELELELSKETYLLHEMIWLDATLTNITADSLRTDPFGAPHHFGFFIDIKDGAGNILKYTGPLYNYGSAPGSLLLDSGQQIYDCFDLAFLYGIWESSPDYAVMGMMFPYIPTGSYTIQARFDGITSNGLSFTVIEPYGVEREAIELIVEATDLWFDDELDLTGLKFQEVVDRYPNSVYAERCFRLSRTYSNRAKEARKLGIFDGIGLRRELLENYPNSGSSGSWLRVIAQEIGETEKQQVLGEFLTKDPNTRAAKFANQMLRRMPKGVEKTID